jgi:hypothetical protein
MKINSIPNKIPISMPLEILEADAYYLAGQAVAICLGNQQKQLPAVHFQICLNPCNGNQPECLPCLRKTYTSSLEGGRLIQSLPMYFAKAKNPQFSFEQAENQYALEADVMNLLAGPLAEAKYNAAQNGKVLNQNGLMLSTLCYYGPDSVTEPVNDYLECCFEHPAERKHKLIELLKASFNFINDNAIWGQVKALAAYILAQSKTVIDCEEINFFLTSWQKSTSLSLLETQPLVCN